MKDSIIDFIESHVSLVRVFLVIVLFIIICLVIRSCNLRKNISVIDEESSLTVEVESSTELEYPTLEIETTLFNPSLGFKAETKDGRVVVTTEAKIEESTEYVNIEWRLEPIVFAKTGVPGRSVDGKSWKGYLNSISLSNFGSKWGSNLTNMDFYSTSRVLVGVDQNPLDTEKGDLQSTGWLIKNIDFLSDNTAVKFTNLHVIGSLSSSHVAMLCTYDWYSAFGLVDVLVVLEDISNTLSVDALNAGDEFSITVFVHNIKVVRVRGYDVLVLQYDTFN